ncbi:MAG: hypothetical protein methR_P1321 [Methyloprofundus sp.]|nr:MAG: hypothetical protein methR_P1321 [Methyloprofundus sp.]
MKIFKLPSLALAISLSTTSIMACAEISTSKAVIKNDGTEHIAASVNYPTPVTGDLYVAIKVQGQLFFLTNGAQSFTQEIKPLHENQEYIGSIPLFYFSSAGVAPGYYTVYQVTTVPGATPLDPNNWIGGANGLSAVNFNIGLPTTINGDFNADGFADDDLNKDGFHDDDKDKDGYHDDDLDHDGYHDDDKNKDGYHDPNGRDLYITHCSQCHGTDPRQNISKISRGTNPASSRRAINRNKGGMGYLNFLSDTELQVIATFIQNPQ